MSHRDYAAAGFVRGATISKPSTCRQGFIPAIVIKAEPWGQLLAQVNGTTRYTWHADDCAVLASPQ